MARAAKQRINVTLPQTTLRLIDHVAPHGERSLLIDEAVRFFVASKGRHNLRRMIREGAIRRGKRDIGIADEWFFLPDA